jgi:hypothetical protein
MLPYCNAMPWNSSNRSIEIIGGDHSSSTGLRHVRYVEASNTFELVTTTTGFTGHGYDHTEVNPYTGDLYHKRYGGLGNQVLLTFRQRRGESSWTQLPAINASMNIIFGTAWWAGPFTGGSGLGAQGGFAIYSRFSTGTSSDGFVGIYDPVSNSWPFQANAMSPFAGTPSGGAYNAVMAYSRGKNVAVFGGGHGSSQRLWRLSSNGTSVELTAAPAEVSVGIHYGLLVDDPVTGNFLLLSKGHLYELNPDGAGTWTKQTGNRVPPESVGYPGNSGPAINLFATALPDHGAIAVVRQTNSGNGAFWLYKHA